MSPRSLVAQTIMTRPKVDPDKRQRTAQACDSCKRRKQKCNGLKPCSTCDKRSLECLYTPTSQETGSQEPLGSPSKRRHIDQSPRTLKLESGQTIATHTPFLASWDQSTNRSMSLAEIEPLESSEKKLMGTTHHLLANNDREFDTRSRISNVSGAADEISSILIPRMLQDKTKKLQYVGESGSLAYVQLIRMIVSNGSGSSGFTEDPLRHNIMENIIHLPPGTRLTGVLPDRKTADILVESFFINTSGLVEVFHKADFLQLVEECYSNPLSASSPDLCILNLVFAVGLVIARPLQGTDEAAVIQSLHSEPINRAELFFRNGKKNGPDSGFEDADFWSIQALILMSLYKLSISGRNASHAYHGMAVRSAQALGLHREEESMAVVFTPHTIHLRRKVWKTLFVLDRILAASLGRPMIISIEDCPEYMLYHSIGATTDKRMIDEVTDSAALDVVVRSCHLVGLTLKKVYAERKVSTLVAQEIADRLESWERELHQDFHCQRLLDGSVDSAQVIASLHINLLHCHSVLLLTRPFFLYLLKMCDDMSRSSKKPPHVSSKLEMFSQACVEASQRTIILARAAFDAEYLSQCNPFVIYFVFSAALILLSNEFASLYHNPDADNAIRSTFIILQYCKERDAIAERVLEIIELFHNANINRPDTAKKIHLPGRKIPTILHTFQGEPMPPLFRHAKTERQEFYMSDIAPTKERQIVGIPAAASEQNMRPMMAPMLQQPSPEGSVSLNSGIAAASMAPGMEALGSGDPEFDFDSLWQGWRRPSSTGGMDIPPPLHHIEPFGSYGLHQPPMPHENNLNHHVQPFPPSNFR